MFGLFQPIMQVTLTEIIDYIEYHKQYRSEAARASMSSFVAKIGNGVSGATPGFALAMTGYLPNAAEQPPAVIMGLIAITALFPPKTHLISALIFGKGYNITKQEMDTVQAELSKRRMTAQ